MSKTERRQIYKYMGDKCLSCGKSVKEMIERYGTLNRMFELNHVRPEQKNSNYKNIIRRSLYTEKIDEIDKCILLCKQCHGILHAQNISGELELSVSFANRTVNQILFGQFIHDKIYNEYTFLTNERLLVLPYFVQIGDRQAELVFGKDLEEDGGYFNCIFNIDEYGSYKVFNYNMKRILLNVQALPNNHTKVVQDISFPFLKLELKTNEENTDIFWIRNGVGISKKGKIIEHGLLTYEFENQTRNDA